MNVSKSIALSASPFAKPTPAPVRATSQGVARNKARRGCEYPALHQINTARRRKKARALVLLILVTPAGLPLMSMGGSHEGQEARTQDRLTIFTVVNPSIQASKTNEPIQTKRHLDRLIQPPGTRQTLNCLMPPDGQPPPKLTIIVLYAGSMEVDAVNFHPLEKNRRFLEGREACPMPLHVTPTPYRRPQPVHSLCYGYVTTWNTYYAHLMRRCRKPDDNNRIICLGFHLGANPHDNAGP
jgi:hypothetical protein